MKIHWEVLTSRDFYQISEQWDTLNQATVNQQITSAAFVTLVIKHFMTGNEKLLLGFKGGKIIAAGIFNKINAFRWTTAQPSQAPLGLWLCSKEYFTSDLFLSLAKELPGPVIILDLLQLDSAFYQVPDDGHFSYCDYISTSALPIQDDFAVYFASLGKNMRQNFNKSKNRLQKSTVKIAFNIITDPQVMDLAATRYSELETNSWKSKIGTAVHAENQQGRFYRELMTSFAKLDKAEIWQYQFNEDIVAVDLCITQGTTLIILKTTFDNAQARYSPSLLMKLDAINQKYAEKKITKIEFFGRTMQWHQRLNSIERSIFHLTWARHATVFSLLARLKKILRNNKQG